jgi:hypothetical protein
VGKDRWGKPGPTGGLHCAKQTQFGPARPPSRRNVRNEPNFRAQNGWQRGPSVRNKANLAHTEWKPSA